MGTQRQASRREWNSRDTAEDINCGSLQRIADATEAMARNHIELQERYNLMLKEREIHFKRVARLENSIRSYRGTITKLKKKLAGK